MATPLTDSINALTTYANEVTGGSDTNLSDAVHTLASGYGGSATLITKTITENGTYSAEDDSADGYSSVTVNVPSSAASSWTKVAETTYQVSTTSTSTTMVAAWETGHSEIWTGSKRVYVRIRDTAGKRAGYFYGSDNFFILTPDVDSFTKSIQGVGSVLRVESDGTYGISNVSNGGYGVYASTLYDDGKISIYRRYHSSRSLTIDGTYSVEVYLLDPPTGAPIFE